MANIIYGMVKAQGNGIGFKDPSLNGPGIPRN